VLASLIRKEFLSLQADPRSPERGQYGFLQDLIRRVAYETLSHRDRKLRHLAAAASLEDTWGSEADEIVEVLMAHYLEAYRLAPDAPDAGEIKAKARDRLIRSGQRAASLAATGEAQRYFEEAIELADTLALKAELHERAGEMALAGNRPDQAEDHFTGAIEGFEREGLPHRAARASTRWAESIWGRGRLHEAMDRMEKAFEVLSSEEPDEDFATLAAQMGRFHFLLGQSDQAMERVEQALEIAELLRIEGVLSHALVTKAIVLNVGGRFEEGMALLQHGLQIALDSDLAEAALRAYTNLCDMMTTRDRYELAIEHGTSGLALARKLGDRYQESFLLSNLTSPLFLTGRWDEVLDRANEIPETEGGGVARLEFLDALIRSAQVHAHRGELDAALGNLALFHGTEESGDVQTSISHALVRATVLRAEGRNEEALASGEEAFAGRVDFGPSHYLVREGFVEAMEAAFALGELDRAESLVATAETLRPGETTMFLQAQVVRFRARLAASVGDEANRAEAQFKEAAGMFRELGTPFWLAVTLLDYGEWLEAQGRSAAEQLEEAGATFDRLGARPWLDRVERTTGAVATAARGRGP
jgi:tetratricopeptide (TPR) repeat protein